MNLKQRLAKLTANGLQKKKADLSQIKKRGTDSLTSTEITSVGITLGKTLLPGQPWDRGLQTAQHPSA